MTLSILKLYCFVLVFCICSSEAGGAVETAAGAAEEGASGESAHGGASERGNQ